MDEKQFQAGVEEFQKRQAEGWRQLEIKVVGKKGRYIQLMVMGKDGREKKMVMFEVERFWDDREVVI